MLKVLLSAPGHAAAYSNGWIPQDVKDHFWKSLLKDPKNEKNVCFFGANIGLDIRWGEGRDSRTADIDDVIVT